MPRRCPVGPSSPLTAVRRQAVVPVPFVPATTSIGPDAWAPGDRDGSPAAATAVLLHRVNRAAAEALAGAAGREPTFGDLRRR